MALQKQSVNINFAQGLDTKTDPNQVQIGKFLALTNSVFTTAGRLTKRNGFDEITELPHPTIANAPQFSSFTYFPAPSIENHLAQVTGSGFLYRVIDQEWKIQPAQTTLTTLNDNLIATGSNLFAYSQDTNQWLDQGLIQPIKLSTQSLVRNSTSQTSPDMGIAPSGLACVAYTDNSQVFYHIIDSSTGQTVVPRTFIANAVAAPRVFVLSHYFIITFIASITGNNHLQYISIPIVTPEAPNTQVDITTSLSNTDPGYDGYVVNGNLYLAWSEDAGDIYLAYLTPSLIVSNPAIITGFTGTLISVTADLSQSLPVIWVSWWYQGDNNGYATAYDILLSPILAPTQIIENEVLVEITSAATGQLLSVFYEVNNDYASPYPVGGVRTDYISTVTIDQTGTTTAPTVILRSVGLASKAFFNISGNIFMLAAYGETAQPTYFLIDQTGAVYMRLAYSNGGGYETDQVLPSVSFQNNNYLIPYLFKDFLTTVNKGVNLPAGTPTTALYTQTGVNLVRFTINESRQYSSEIAQTLHLTGGQLWMYDTVKPVEHGFQVWPENVQVTTDAAGGDITANSYSYSFTYEWTDNQGNLHRSAPSIPFLVTTVGSTSSNTAYVPTLRLTYKTEPNPVRIVGYRWSASQQVFYQFTSVTVPDINDTTIDFIEIIDTLSDQEILGNTILYTTGGVVENIAAPGSIASALFKNRLFLIDAENRNQLWFSKQVIQGVPVEMSDLFTLFIAPTSGAQGSTGPLTALSAMDDKLIVFKENAIYYITGTGPDNTAASNDFSDTIFITSSVGCSNPNSIVLVPNGIMFQSNKGIWLLGRDLSTSYIGQDVEAFNNNVVLSATNIPATTQVRFILDNNKMLMYDYFYGQWGTFTNRFAISSTLYQGLHTYLNEFGFVYQENKSSYQDGSDPVLMSFTTAWINIAGLQGYERFYFMYLLGTYLTPFRLNIGIAYNYNPGPMQTIEVIPDNFTPAWGEDQDWGSNSNWGGGQGTQSSADSSSNILSARIFPQQQKCESFQIYVQEVYDPNQGVTPGAGLTLSGLNMVVGMKKGYRTQKSSQSFG